MIGLMTFVGMTAVPFSARADITVTGTETAGGDVMFEYSGSVDLTGLTSAPNIGIPASAVIPNSGALSFFGVPVTTDRYLIGGNVPALGRGGAADSS